MKQIRGFFNQIFSPHKPLPAGFFHYQAPAQDEKPYRLHLRIDPDGNGILIVNARTVLHLNATATEFAYHFIKKTSDQATAASIGRRYNITKTIALKDYQAFKGRIETLIHSPQLDPETTLDFERVTPYSKDILAPYRLDCAITYRLPGNISANFAPQERVKRELTTVEWKTILQKAWNAGIPQLIFTGGEPTQREDLSELIIEAERLGLVSGVLTDGLKLADKNYLDELLKSGLDHIMFLLEADDQKSWGALKIILATDLFTTVHLTITSENENKSVELLKRLSKLGVRSLSISTNDEKLKPVLKLVQHEAAHRQLSLVWDLPVPYSECHPIAFEMLGQDDQLVKGAGKAWLYVEPDGDVLPAQGINQVLGNLLADEWTAIWKNRPV